MRRLNHKFYRSGIQRIQNRFAHGAHYDHRQGVLRQQAPDKFDPIHFGHIDVACHDIGPKFDNFVAGVEGVGALRHHLNLWIRRDALRNKLPEHEAVVDNQHFYFSVAVSVMISSP
jgi:hypothetical protein